MFKNIIILLLFTATLSAHEDGSEHLHLLGFMHSSEFGISVVIVAGIFILYKYLERKNV
ncbi:MAG: hypothetical protein ABXS92_06345 [Sulfurimonas sp.]